MKFGTNGKHTNVTETLTKILETKDPAEQVRRLGVLANQATAPTITLIIQLDPRQSPRPVFSLLGLEPSLEALHQIIEAARQELVRAEREAAANAAAVQNPSAA